MFSYKKLIQKTRLDTLTFSVHEFLLNKLVFIKIMYLSSHNVILKYREFRDKQLHIVYYPQYFSLIKIKDQSFEISELSDKDYENFLENRNATAARLLKSYL